MVENQDPEYRKKVYNALKTKVEGFNKTEAEFNTALQDPTYVKNVHAALTKKVGGFNKSIDEFSTLVTDLPVKKKESSSATKEKSVSKPQNGSSESSAYDKLAEKYNFTEIEKVLPKKSETIPTTPKKNNQSLSDYVEENQKEAIKKDEGFIAFKKDLNAENKAKRVEKIATLNQQFDTALEIEGEEDFINEKKIEADNLANIEGFRTKIEYGAKNLWNKAASFFTDSPDSKFDLNPLGEQYNKVKKELEEKGEDVNKIPFEVIQELAKEKYIKEQVEDKKLSLANDFLQNLPDEDKKLLELDKLSKLETINQKDKTLLKGMKVYDLKIEDITNKVEVYYNKSKTQQLSEEDINDVKKLTENFNKIAAERKAVYQTYIENNKELGSLEEEYDVLRREYGSFNKNATKVTYGVGKIGVGFAQFSNMVFGFIGTEEDNTEIRETLSKADESLKSMTDDLQKETKSVHNVNDIIDYTTDLISNQAPNLALMYATGGTSNVLPLISIGAYSTGNKFSEMLTSNRKGESDYTMPQMYLAAITSGSAEAIESNTLKMFGGAKRVISSALSNEPTRVLFKKSIANRFSDFSKGTFKNVKGEIMEEEATNLVQNFSDKYILGDENVGLFDNSVKVMKDAATMSAILGVAPQVMGTALKPFAPKNYVQTLDENSKKIEELSRVLLNENLSPETRKATEDMIFEKSKNIENVFKKIIENNTKLSDEQLEKVIDLELETSGQRAIAKSIQDDKSLNPEQKETLLKEIQGKYNKNEELREKIVSGNATSLDVMSEEKVLEVKKEAVAELIKENPNTTEANYTTEVIQEKALEIYNAKNKVEEDKTEQPIVEQTIADTKEQVAEAKPAPSVSKSNNNQISEPTEINTSEIVKEEIPNSNQINNEATPKENIVADGSIRPGATIVDQNGEQQSDSAENVSEAIDTKSSEGKVEIKLEGKGNSYSVSKNNGIISITDSKGKTPSKPTQAKILDKYSETINFTEGSRVDESFDTSAETYLDDIAEKSKNAAEIAEAITYAQTQDFNDNKNPIEIAIANAIGSKSIKRSSSTNFGDRNNITQGIALQYFAKVGKGKTLDLIAMEVEYEIYGDYDASNPRVSPQDIVDFITENPGGTQKFLNDNKNQKLDALKTAFTDVTGLPANDNFVNKAIQQQTNKKDRLQNEEVLYAYSQEELVSLSEELKQFEEGTNGKKTNDTGNAISVNPKNEEGSGKKSRIQEETGREIGERQASSKQKESVEDNITTEIKDIPYSEENQDGVLDFLDTLKLDPNTTNATLPFLPQTWNLFIDAIKLAYKSGKSLLESIEIAKQKLKDKGISDSEIAKIVDYYNKATSKSTPKTFERKVGQRSLLQRLRNGGNAAIVNKAIDKIGLTYEKQNNEKTYADAVNFVNEVGTAEAYNAIKEGRIKNPSAVTVIYAEIIDRLPQEIENALSTITNNDELLETVKEFDSYFEGIVNEYSTRATEFGQANSILNYIYNNAKSVKYSLSKQIENHKAINGGVVDVETMAKLKELDKKYQEATKKVKELEEKHAELLAQQAFNQIIEEHKRKISLTNKKPNSAQAKKIANSVRKLKINKPGIFKSSTGADLVWDGAVELVAKSIETTGNVADAINQGIDFIKKSNWYKNLSNQDKMNAEQQFVESFEDIQDNTNEDISIDKNGKIKITGKVLVDYINNGGSDINELVDTIKKEIETDFPHVSKREIRDAITGYGNRSNKTRTELQDEISRLKNLGKLQSELEDIKNSIAKNKGSKSNRRRLTDKEKSLSAQIKTLQDGLGITEANRTERSKEYTKKRIEEIKQKIKVGDFSKKEVKPIQEDAELKKLRIEKNRLEEDFEKLKHKNELENRTLWDKIKDWGGDLWDMQRVTRATGELSFVGAQGGFYVVDGLFSRKTVKNLIKNVKGTKLSDWKPKNILKTVSNITKSSSSADTIVEMFAKMANKNNYDEFESLLKEHPFYDVFVKSKLRILGEDAKTQVKDEHFYGNVILSVLRLPAAGMTYLDKDTKRTTIQGLIEKIRTGKVSEKNKKTFSEMTGPLTVTAALERGNNTFMNMARVDLFMRGAKLLELQGKNPIDHIEEYKKLASAVNTITGSANLSQTMTMAVPILNKLVFSTRYWASSLNLTPPISLYYFFKLGNYDGVFLNNPKTWINLKEVSVAQKTFVRASLKGMLAFYGAATYMLYLLNSAKDEEEEKAYIEYDPRSSNFMQIIDGKKKTDMFGPYRNNVVLFSRLLTRQTKDKHGEIKNNGDGIFSRTNRDIFFDYVSNKANPFPGMFLRNAAGKIVDVENESTGKIDKKVMLFDEDVSIDQQAINNMYPIFIDTTLDIIEEDPQLGSELYIMLSFIGKQTSVY